MAKVKAFRGYRAKKELSDKLPSLPYDVMNTEEAKEMAKDNEASFLHVVRPEIDLPESIDIHAEEVYQKGAENLRRFMKEGTLVQEDKPALYIYSQKMGDHFQTGIVGLASTKEYFDDKIKKHEHTKPAKVEDRTKHIDTQGAHAGPVFLTYRNRSVIDNLVKEIQQRTPDVDFVAPDGIGHTLWVVSDESEVKTILDEFGSVDYLYIADGHHRSASAANIHNWDKTDKTAFFLAVFFPENELAVMGYHRTIKDLNDLSVDEFKAKIAEKFDIEATTTAEPEKKHIVSMYLDGSWYKLTMKPEIIDENDPVNRLDCAILQNNVLGPILGIDDPRTSKRIDFIGGIRGTGELEKLVNIGKFKVAFAMFPVTIADLMKVADAGDVMPCKSTWFEPKLRSGMVVNVFRD